MPIRMSQLQQASPVWDIRFWVFKNLLEKLLELEFFVIAIKRNKIVPFAEICE